MILNVALLLRLYLNLIVSCLNCKLLDAKDRFASKAHCEIAGRCIQHAWATAKVKFRRENSTLDDDERANNMKQKLSRL